MAERRSSQLPPGPPRKNREDLPTLVVAPRINTERNKAYLNLLDDGHRDLSDLRVTYAILENRQVNRDRLNDVSSSDSLNDIDDFPLRTFNPSPGTPLPFDILFPSNNDENNTEPMLPRRDIPAPVLNITFSSEPLFPRENINSN